MVPGRAAAARDDHRDPVRLDRGGGRGGGGGGAAAAPLARRAPVRQVRRQRGRRRCAARRRRWRGAPAARRRPGGAANPGYPRGYKVETSLNGTTWTPVATGQGTGATTTITFKPTQAKFVRLTQTATTENAPPWSITQLRVFEVSDAAGRRSTVRRVL